MIGSMLLLSALTFPSLPQGVAALAPAPPHARGTADSIGTVLAAHKLGSESPGFLDALDTADQLGAAVVGLGDLDGDGIPDLAVGAVGEDSHRGAVYVLFLRADGSVRDYQKISSRRGGLTVELEPTGYFGAAIARLDDLDGDGVPELAVGAPGPQDGRFRPLRGKLWILFLRPDGTVKDTVALDPGLVGGALGPEDAFGGALTNLGDLDGNGHADLAVGASGDAGLEAPPSRFGAVWILFLGPGGTLEHAQKIGPGSGGFAGSVERFDGFGRALATLDDLDGDGLPELAVGAFGASSARGTAWILFLAADGTVRVARDVFTNGFAGQVDANDLFGISLAALDDLDGDGIGELAVGAPLDDDGSFDHGAVWTLHLDASGSVREATKTSDTSGGFSGLLRDNDHFGSAIAAVDVDQDGTRDLCVGATGNRGPNLQNDLDVGAVWCLFLRPDASVREFAKIDGNQPALAGTLDRDEGFGAALAELGDLDGDGLREVAVGAPGHSGARGAGGGVWILSLDEEGGIQRHHVLGAREGGMANLRTFDAFGRALCTLDDLDGDGRRELAVGAWGDDDGPGFDDGAVWILFLTEEGTVDRAQKISATSGGFGGLLSSGDRFGTALASPGDLDGDGLADLAVGAPRDSATGSGAVWLLFLNADGTVKGERQIATGLAGFDGALNDDDDFGSALAPVGDLDHNGIVDLAVGAPGDDDGSGPFSDRGAVWVLFLEPGGSVLAHAKISSTSGNFGGTLSDRSGFGIALANLGDLDQDGIDECVVGANHTFPTSVNHAWLLSLDEHGTVRREQRLDRTLRGLRAVDAGSFGISVARLGDLDQDGLPELVLGTPGDSEGDPGQGSFWIVGLDGIAAADFETGADLATPLGNGRALTGDELGRAVRIAVAGSNLGAALFDSTPGGPNDPGGGADLLVARGNLLIAQDSLAPTQTEPGVFDVPAADPDPSGIAFTFLREVEPLSLDLVDLDLAPDEHATVSLIDRSGRKRTYKVPAGWTGDRVVDGTAGVGRLDLTTLQPQPGFASSAVALESPGFRPSRVVRIVVELGSRAALDALRWRPHPLAPGLREH